MKKVYTMFLALGLSLFAFSQSKINVVEEQNTLSVGSVNTLTVMVYGMSMDDVEKAWKKQMKDINGNVKAKKEVFADDCLIKDMSDNTFDVYTIFRESKLGVQVIATYDLGGAFLNSTDHKEFFGSISKMMYEFAVKQTKEAVSADIKTAENDLKDTEKAKEDLEKDIKKLEKEIEDYKKKIEDNKASIEQDKKDIEERKKEIVTKTEVVKALEKKREAIN
jgi:valyl-tRNA synthetase